MNTFSTHFAKSNDIATPGVKPITGNVRYSRKFYLRLLAMIFLILSNVMAQGQLLQYDTGGNTGLETTEPPFFFDPGIASANLTLGSGVTPAADANRFGGINWSANLANAIAGNDYIEFIVTPTAGMQFTATSFFFIWYFEAGGPNSVTMRSSLNGFTTDIGSETGMTSGGTHTMTLSGVTNVAVPVTFRLYGWGGTTAGGGFDVISSAIDAQLDGFVSPVAPVCPPATITYAGSPYCSNAGTATVTRTGPGGGTYSSTAGLTLDPANGDVTLGTSTAGTYTVTYTIAAGGGCPLFTTTASITITALPSATINYAGSPYCSNAGTANVTRTGTAGGTYSSTAGLTLNPATGAVTLGTSTPGTYTVTYTIAASGGCPLFTTTASITITALPAPTINYAGSPYCSNAGTATVTRTGTAGGTYSSTAGLTLNAANGDVTLGTSTAGTYTVTYTIAAAGGCPVVTTTTTITITASPSATIIYAGSPYCSNAGVANVTRTGTAGGTYSSTAGLTLNAATGAVTLGTSTAGTYTVTYTIAAAGGCPLFTTTTTITITALPSATINYAGSPYCSNAGTATVTRTGTAGGTYSSTAGLTLNAANGDVTLGTSTAGTYTVTYTIAAAGGCPAVTATTSITINTPPTIVCPANITVNAAAGTCAANVSFAATVTGSPAPTVTTVPASGSSFPIGTTTVNVTATNICGTATCSFTVTVLDVQIPNISTQPASQGVCVGNNAIFTVVSTFATSYQWQAFNGTTWNNIAGATTSTLTVGPVTYAMNTNSYRVLITGPCGTVTTSTHATITANLQPTVVIVASIPPVLLPGQFLTLTAVASPPGGTYVWKKNGNVISGATSSTLPGLTVNDIGIYQVTYTDPNGCGPVSATITVSGQPSTNLYVYPNPSTGTFQIRFYNQSNEAVTVNVFDANGTLVYQRNTITTTPYSSIEVRLGNQPQGSYLVQVVNSAGVAIGSKWVLVNH